MKIIWVATTGSDITGDGSQDNPYAGIEKALESFDSGDQIRILDGTYIPTDSIVISGRSGSIFAENPEAVYIQPEKTRAHQACLAVIDADRFSIYGINVLQAADTSGNLIGMYIENVDTFLAYTCTVSEFDITSGNAYGIYASGDLGRVERCRVFNMESGGGELIGIKLLGIESIENEVHDLTGSGDCIVKGIEENGNTV